MDREPAGICRSSSELDPSTPSEGSEPPPGISDPSRDMPKQNQECTLNTEYWQQYIHKRESQGFWMWWRDGGCHVRKFKRKVYSHCFLNFVPPPRLALAICLRLLALCAQALLPCISWHQWPFLCCSNPCLPEIPFDNSATAPRYQDPFTIHESHCRNILILSASSTCIKLNLSCVFSSAFPIRIQSSIDNGEQWAYVVARSPSFSFFPI